MNNIDFFLKEFIEKQDPAGSSLFPGASEQKINSFLKACKENLGTLPPQDYLEFLKRHDGFVAEGVFLYSSATESTENDGELSFIEINLSHRDLPWNKDFLFFGDSDMDVYVLDLDSNTYQTRDKQAFDNVYDNFNSFIALLEHILNEAISRM